VNIGMRVLRAIRVESEMIAGCRHDPLDGGQITLDFVVVLGNEVEALFENARGPKATSILCSPT